MLDVAKSYGIPLFFLHSSVILHMERFTCFRKHIFEDVKFLSSFELQQTRLRMKILKQMMVALVRNGSNKGTIE